ncbi:MAG: hypothetical protein ACYDHZ_05615 [Dehalococcoidia bacterium]
MARKERWQVIKYIAIVILGAILLLIAAGMALNLFPPLTAIFSAVQSSFVWVGGILVTLYGVWKIAPDPLKALVAIGLRKLPNLPIYFKRRTVQLELESEINSALREFGKEGLRFVEHEINITWLVPGENARKLFFRSGKAYLKLDFSEDKECTLVDAVLIYCNDCLLPELRQYVHRPLMRAIDLIFVDELLDRRNATRGRTYFIQEIIPREVSDLPEINRYLDTFELLSQHGLFIRILLPELRDYPGRIHRLATRRSNAEQIEAFIDFLKITAEDRTNIVKRVWLHVGESIRTAIILVGIPNKLQFEGTKPYIRRIAIDSAKGARTVYLLGYNLGVIYVPKIAEEARLRGIVDKYELNEYEALIGGDLKRQTLARLIIPTDAGRRFLNEFPNTTEWPDLEDESHTVASVIPLMGPRIADISKTESDLIDSQKPEKWELELDVLWSKRANRHGQWINGPEAAKDAAKVLNTFKLSTSPFKTFRELFTASDYLRSRWTYSENRVIREPSTQPSLSEVPITESASITSQRPEKWELELDISWSRRANQTGQSIHGPVAASDAAKILNVEKLAASRFKTFRTLFEASEYLRSRWTCSENKVTRQ